MAKCNHKWKRVSNHKDVYGRFDSEFHWCKNCGTLREVVREWGQPAQHYYDRPKILSNPDADTGDSE